MGMSSSHVQVGMKTRRQGHVADSDRSLEGRIQVAPKG